MEGYAVTGNYSTAQCLTTGGSDCPGPIEAGTFDEAVRKFMELVPNHGIEKNERNRYISDQAYQNRSSNWNIWAGGGR